MKTRSATIGALALALLLFAAACGGKDDTNSGERPSVQEISTAMERDLPEVADDDEASGQLRCMAEKLHESDLPNGVLRAIVDGREAEVDKDNEKKYTEIVNASVGACIAEALEDLDLPSDMDLPDGLELPDQE